MQAASSPAEAMARSDSISSGALARLRAAPPLVQSLAASDTPGTAKVSAAADANLLLAASLGDAVAVRAALQAGASANARDAQGHTVLMLAARSGSREAVDLLLAAGARKADRDAQGWSAADHAQVQGRGELVDLLR